MTYLDSVAAASTPTAIAALIAAEADSVKWALDQRYGTLVWKHRSHAQARRNRAHNEAILNALRHVWTLANQGNPAWRDALIDFIGDHETTITGGNKLIRYRLIAECAPAAEVNA